MKNPMDMTGRHVLVTGASSGIGQATAILLAELGCQVILVARNEERLQATRAKMPGNGHVIKAFDLSKVEAIEPWLKEVIASTGPINGLVHSAGIHRIVPIRFEKASVDDPLWRLNYHAATALLTTFSKVRNRAKNASVVFVSSIAGLIGVPGVSTYSATKGALIAYARTAAIELARESIRVNCVAPGYVRTEMSMSVESKLTDAQTEAIEVAQPLGFGRPEDVANAIIFLLAETGRWITGTSVVVDGGCTAH
jgi:NAD(P)-dependent dehydrogenase (short-subunit alcohol dehydrogenase family)